MKHVLYITSALLYIFSFPPFDFSYCAWICLVPLICAVDRERNIRSAAAGSFVCGLAVFLGSMYWLARVTAAGYILLSFLFALFFVIPAVLRFFSKGLLIFPLAWTVSEFARSRFLGGMPWMLLGASRYRDIPLIQAACITGVYGLSFLTALVNSAAADLFRRRMFPLAFAASVTAICLVCGTHSLRGVSGGVTLDAAVIQPNIGQDIKWDPRYAQGLLKRLVRMSKEVEGADIIIWPETALPLLLDMPQGTDEVKSLAKYLGSYIVAGAQGRHKNGYTNSAFLISPKGEMAGEYEKIHLVPFGEYVPFKSVMPFLKRLVPFDEGFIPGHRYAVFPMGSKGVNISVLICFEDTFPGLARQFVKNGADILVNITNDAWFGKTGALLQHACLSVFRAVENHTPLIRAANTGLSCFIDTAGRMYPVEPFAQKAVSFKVHTREGGDTFYTRYGDIFSFLCAAVLLGGLYAGRIKKNAGRYKEKDR